MQIMSKLKVAILEGCEHISILLNADEEYKKDSYVQSTTYNHTINYRCESYFDAEKVVGKEGYSVTSVIIDNDQVEKHGEEVSRLT